MFAGVFMGFVPVWELFLCFTLGFFSVVFAGLILWEMRKAILPSFLRNSCWYGSMSGEMTVWISKSLLKNLGVGGSVAWSCRVHLVLPWVPNFMAVNHFLPSPLHLLGVYGVTSGHNGCSTNPCMKSRKQWDWPFPGRALVSCLLLAESTFFPFLVGKGSLESSSSPDLQVRGSETWGPEYSLPNSDSSKHQERSLLPYSDALLGTPSSKENLTIVSTWKWGYASFSLPYCGPLGYPSPERAVVQRSSNSREHLAP